MTTEPMNPLDLLEAKRRGASAPVDPSPEEIGEAADRAGSFTGTRLCAPKAELYHEIYRDITRFLTLCPDRVYCVNGYPINARERNAVVWMDLTAAAILDKDETAALAYIMAKADGVVMSTINDHVRITFQILGVWTN